VVDEEKPQNQERKAAQLMMRQRYLGLIFGVVAAVVLLRLLGVSVGSLGLLVVVLACPLMMFFMMRSMGGMNDRGRDDDSRDQLGSSR
jgi:uncharacterized membrane protein YccC